MLGDGHGSRAAEHALTWLQHDDRHLRQRERETLRYREIPSRARWWLSIQVAVVILSKIVGATPKQCDDTLRRVRRHSNLARRLPTLRCRLSDSFQRPMVLDHGQLNFLLVFEPDFPQRLKNSVLIDRIKAFAMSDLFGSGECHKAKLYRPVPVLSNMRQRNELRSRNKMLNQSGRRPRRTCWARTDRIIR